MENNQPKELTKKEIETMELAVALSKEVIQEMQIEHISAYIPQKYEGQKCTFYTSGDDRTVMIYVYLEYEFGFMKIEFFLNVITVEIISILRKLLSNETAHEVLKPPVIRTLQDKGIDIFTLFDTEEKDVEEDVKYTTKKILDLFIQNIPFIARVSVVDALSSSMVGYSQNFIRQQLREHWLKLGLPKDFNLILDSDIEKIRKLNIDRRKWFLGDKKQLLNEWVELGLADEADRLRNRFRIAKARYKEAMQGLESLDRSPKNDEWFEKWAEAWTKICINEFSDLNYKATMRANIEFRPAHELVLVHLANFYGYDEAYIKKKITKSRSQKKKENN